MLERDFNPTLQDASKINTLPAVHNPVVKQANIQFETRQPLIEFERYRLGDTGSGDIKTAVGYDKKRGYLSLGAGYYSSLYGALGYKLVNTQTDQLDIFARYNAISGKVKYAEKDYLMDEAKGKYENLLVKAKYGHSFEALTWKLQVGYENTGYNYYGNPFDAGTDEDFEFGKKQSVNVINAETGITSNNNSEFGYDVALMFNNFTSKYGPQIANDGVSGNILGARLNMSAPFGGDKHVGVRSSIMNQSYSDVDFTTQKDKLFHNLTVVKATPYFDIEGGNYYVSLGANFHYAIDDENKLQIAPNVNLSWQFVDKSLLYIGATGGINDNNFLDILRENRYADMNARVKYSKTLYDATIGIKSGAIQGFEFDIFGGYKQTNDDHLYVVNSIDRDPAVTSWGNVSTPIYNDIKTGHFGGLLKTTLIPYTDLSAKVVSYFYNGDDYTNENGENTSFEAWNRPKLTVNVDLNFKPSKELTFSLNYLMASGRKAFYEGASHKMNNINELNFRGEYQFLDWLSINASVYNLMNQKYETWAGYTHQGLSAMGGLSLKF